MKYLAHAAFAISILAASAFGTRRPSRLVVVSGQQPGHGGLVVAIWAMLQEP
jgi:hypothetical protein